MRDDVAGKARRDSRAVAPGEEIGGMGDRLDVQGRRQPPAFQLACLVPGTIPANLDCLIFFRLVT